jgi:hypothetical protein
MGGLGSVNTAYLLKGVIGFGLRYFLGDLPSLFFPGFFTGLDVLAWVFANMYVIVIVLGKLILINLIVVRVRHGHWVSMFRDHNLYSVLYLRPHCHGDERPDSLRDKDISHDNPAYARVRYSRVRVGLFWHSMCEADLNVSLELFTQMTTAKIMQIDSDPSVVKERLNRCAATSVLVNISRKNVFDLHDVPQHTTMLAYGYFLSMQSRVRNIPF